GPVGTSSAPAPAVSAPPPASVAQSPTGPVSTFGIGNAPAPQGAPQSLLPSPTPQPAGGLFSAPTPDSIDQTAVGGIPANFLRTNAMWSQDPASDLQKLHAAQLAAVQQREAPLIGMLDTARQSANPMQLIRANQQLSSAWPQIAAAAGVDPATTDAGAIRTALAVARNSLAASVSQPTVAPPIRLQNVPGGVGGAPLAQINPVNNEYKPVAQQDTANFVTPQGQIRMMPKAEGMRLGYTPYTPQTFVNTGTTGGVAQMIADYQMAPLSASAMRSPQGQAIMAQVRQLNPAYDATQYSTKNKARESFATGKQGDTVRSLSVATDHLDLLNQAVDALNNGNVRVLNTIGNRWTQETGGAAPTNFDTLKNVVADEVTKAVIGYGGSTADRDKAAAVIGRSNSPAQLKGAIQNYLKLMGGQLDGLRRQYEHSTGLHDFDSMLSPQAQSEVESNAPNTAAKTSASDAALLKKWGG